MNITEVNNRVDQLCQDAQRDIVYYKFMHVVFTAISFVSFALIFRNVAKYKVAIPLTGAYGFYRMACSYLIKANQTKMQTALVITRQYTYYIEGAKEESATLSNVRKCTQIVLTGVLWTTGLNWIDWIQKGITALSHAQDVQDVVNSLTGFNTACNKQCQRLIVEAVHEGAIQHLDRITGLFGLLRSTEFPGIKEIVDSRLRGQLADRVIDDLKIEPHHHETIKNKIIPEILKQLNDIYKGWEKV